LTVPCSADDSRYSSNGRTMRAGVELVEDLAALARQMLRWYRA
jgi:hypothetical protein